MNELDLINVGLSAGRGKVEANAEVPYFQIRNISEVFADGAAQPERLRIFGDFLRQETNTLFFSNTNYGKSLLAFQIAVNAATGQSFSPSEALRNECQPMTTLLGDFEMDSKTLNDRHACALQHYDPNLLAANLHVIHENPAASAVYGQNLLEKIEIAAIRSGAKLVIVDNLTKVAPDLLKADEVTKVIDTFKRIRQKTGASFLVIGHSVKSLQNFALTENSYYGSAHIKSFFTEIFYMDRTKTDEFLLRHAKTKQREAWFDMVPVLTRGDHPHDGSGFQFSRFARYEDVMLPLPNTRQNKVKPSDFRSEILSMSNAGISQVRIAEIFGCSRSAVSQILNP